jgi:hypothetical protein
MARDLQTGFFGIIFHPFLDASNRQGLTFVDTSFNQEDLLNPASYSRSDIICQHPVAVVADIDNPIFAALTVKNVDSLSPPIDRLYGQVGHLGHPQAGAEHQHKYGQVAFIIDDTQKAYDFNVFKVFGQRFREPQLPTLSDRVVDGKFFFIPQKIIKPADGHQMAIDRFGRHAFSEQMVDVRTYFLVRHLLDRLIDPNDELLEIVQIAPKGVG